MRVCEECIVVFVGILMYNTVLSSKRMFDEFKEVDSDFDLEQAVADFKIEDIANITEDLAKITDLGPKPAKAQNISSVEITKLLKMGEELLDSPTERKLNELRRIIIAKDKEERKLKNMNETKPVEKKRVKRQGKFQEAAKVDNLKMLRIYLTMFKNLWTRSYVGGVHPLHRDVPKSVCILFKHRIMKFFFPPVGDDKKV